MTFATIRTNVPLKAIELIRVSTEAQARDDRASIPAQRTANRRTAASFNLEIVRSIEYFDVSGASVLLSPEMREVMTLMREPDIHGVLAYTFSRLMRPEDYSDFALMQHFVNTNTILYLPDGPIDFASKTGRILGPLRAAMAGVERLEMLEKVWGAKEEKRKSGGFSQSAVCLPYGVGHGETGWFYKPESAKVKEAFRLLLAGESYTLIARLLGVSIAGAKKILSNSIYTGLRVIDEKRDPSPAARRTGKDGRQGDRPKIKRAPDEVIRVRVIEKPLIRASDFETAQNILSARRRMNARTRSEGNRAYTYNGFLRCSTCGLLVYTHFRRANYYVCKGRKLLGTCQTHYMRRDILDPKLDMVFAERLRDESFWRAIAERVLETKPDETEGLATEVTRLESRRSRILDTYFDGKMKREERDSRLEKLDSEIETLRRSLGSLKPVESPNPMMLADLFEVFDDFPTLERNDKRAILAACVPEIHVADYCITGLSVMLPRGDEFTRTDTGLVIPAQLLYLPVNVDLSM